MKTAQVLFGITTCPRREPTFDVSKASLLKAADNPNYIVFSNDGTIGSFAAYEHATKELIRAAKKKGAPYICVVPDDIVYAQNFLEALPDSFEGYHALYTPKGLGERLNLQPGWNQIKGGWASSWGLGYVMSVETAERMVANSFWIAHSRGVVKSPQRYLNYAKGKRTDHVTAEVMHRLGLPQMFHAPSLVKHVGYTSTIGHVHTENEEPYLWA